MGPLEDDGQTIAVFGPNSGTAFAGRSLVISGHQFTIEGVGKVSVNQITEYEHNGLLIWSDRQVYDQLLDSSTLAMENSAGLAPGKNKLKLIIAIVFAAFVGLAAISATVGAISGAIKSAGQESSNQRLAAGLNAMNANGDAIKLVISKFPNGPLDKPYVSVGWAADYPDKMLVTIVWPSTYAFQVMFRPGATSSNDYLPKEIGVASLDESLKHWNATTDAQGNVLLNGYERESEPAESSSAGYGNEPSISNGQADDKATSSGRGGASSKTLEDENSTAALSERAKEDARQLGGRSHRGETLYFIVGAGGTPESFAQMKLDNAADAFDNIQFYFIVQKSDNFDGMDPGWFVVIDAYRTKDDAEKNLDNAMSGFADGKNTPYIKKATVKTDDPIPVNYVDFPGQG